MAGDRITRRPATTKDGRENQLIALAIELAEKQLKKGTASSQVITHFLKLASSREELEQERLKNENLLLAAKAENLTSAKEAEARYDEALKAMRTYQGIEVDVDDFG